MDQRVPLFDWPEEGVRRTPYLVYSDPDVYEAEMARIFRGRTWHYLALEVETTAGQVRFDSLRINTVQILAGFPDLTASGSGVIADAQDSAGL